MAVPRRWFPKTTTIDAPKAQVTHSSPSFTDPIGDVVRGFVSRLAWRFDHAIDRVPGITTLRRSTVSYLVRSVPVSLPPAHAALVGLRVLQLSDLHADGICDKGEALVRILESLECDICALTGDFTDPHASQSDKAFELLRFIVGTIRTRLGCVAVLGNHDTTATACLLGRVGVTVLRNQSVPLVFNGHTLSIAGVDDPKGDGKPDLAAALGGIPCGRFTLLLSHTPYLSLIYGASAGGVSYVLSGHTHGGQVCLPGSVPIFTNGVSPRWLARGPWAVGGLPGYTSSGVGTGTLRLRVGCPPEVVMHCFLPSNHEGPRQ